MSKKQWHTGWYQDLEEENLERYWNGSEWTGEKRIQRRPFAAPAENETVAAGAGGGSFVAFLIGVIQLFSEDDPTVGLVLCFVGAFLAIIAVYVGRARGNPEEVKKALQVIDLHARVLDGAVKSGKKGEANVSLHNLTVAVETAHGPDSLEVLDKVLSQTSWDPSSTRSERIGSVSTQDGKAFEVYQDYIVCGESAYDTELSSEIEVVLEGQIQSVPVYNDKGKFVRYDEIDHRRASIHYRSVSDSFTTSIDPNEVDRARGIAGQYNALVSSLSPKAVTASQMKEMIDEIVEKNGATSAEKIQQLDKLRYQQLLSDDEWNAAKTRILGLL